MQPTGNNMHFHSVSHKAKEAIYTIIAFVRKQSISINYELTMSLTHLFL